MYKLKINDELVDWEVFVDEDALKKHLTAWNWETANFTVQGDDTVYDVDGFVKLLKEKKAVVCTVDVMCEMGDDYVDIELVEVK